VNSAKKLPQFDFDADAFTRRAPKPIAIPSDRLAVLKKITKKHDGKGSGPPDPESLRKLDRLFIGTTASRLSVEFDTVRRIRQLAWGLTYSEDGLPRIVDTQRLCEAFRLIEKRFSISALLGVFKALLQAWDSPNAGMLRAFVKRHLADYDGSRTFVRQIQANIAWYCEENSAVQFATMLLRLKKKLSDVWSFLGLPDYMNGYRYFGAVAEAYVSISKIRNVEIVIDVIDFVKKHNSDKTSRTVLSKLIKQLGNDASESLRQPVQSYVLQKWQDPRLAGADVHWRSVSDEARRIFTRWITKEDLRFFFDVVAKACNDLKFAYRKAFWLTYLERISFCRPVLRRDAEYLFSNNQQALQYYRDRRPATLKGGNSAQHAFIIQIDGFTFVEFSTAGACHVYYNPDLPFELGDSEYHMSQLRCRSSAIHRVIHFNSEKYSWQEDFSFWLKDEIGIEALRSYRLDRKPNAYPTSETLNLF